MTVPPVVSDSSALIALDHIGQLHLLRLLFSEIIIPPAVSRETAVSVALSPWIIERALSQPIEPRVLGASVGDGESEAISLALELAARWVVLDDRPVRRLAQWLGLPVIGTLGVLIAAKRQGFLPVVRPCLDALVASGFRITPQLYEHILADAGEI